MKKLPKEEKGITLIALVITIIVLLILAGISIASLTGNNGILTKAGQATEEYKMKSAEEKVKLAIMSYQVNKENTTIYDELIKIEGLTLITPNDRNGGPPYTVIVDGYEFLVKEDLSIEYKGEREDAKENLPEITKVEYEQGEVTDGLTVTITAKTADVKGLKEINVYYKKVEGENVKYETIKTQEVSGAEASITAEIPINGEYVIQAIGGNSKIGTKEISIVNIKEGSVLASITGGDVTDEAKATITIVGRGQGRAIKKMELFVDGKSTKTYEYQDMNLTREESYIIENLEFYKDVNCYVKTIDTKNEEKTSEVKTVTNTKIIKTATDLRNLAIQVNERDNTFASRTVKLIDNIETGENWIPIGYGNSTVGKEYTGKYFAGTFEGNNKTVTINSSSKDTTYQSSGLFGMGIECTINSVTINGKIDAQCKFIGGIIGKLKDGTVNNCTNNSQITDTTENAHGGIVGTMIHSQILNCSNINNIFASSGTGGICGTNNVLDVYTDEECIILNCTNSGLIKSYGNVNNTNSYAGGICGIISSARIENCTNIGEITANRNTIFGEEKGVSAGGIMGQAIDSTITISKNSGKVNFESTGESIRTTGGLGGIIGVSYNTIIDQCFNTGEITSNYKTHHVAGISGYSYGSTIKNSYNKGDVCGYSEVGGVVGQSNVYEENNNYIYNSYNANESVLGSSVTGNLGGNCTYITGKYTASITGKTDIATKGTSCSITNKTYTLTQMKTLNSGLLTLLSNEEGKGVWKQETGVNDNLPYLVNNRP